MFPPRARSRLLAPVLAGALLGAAVVPVRAAPPRPSLDARIRLIQSHARAPVPVELPRPASGQDDVDVLHYDLLVAPSIWQAHVQGTVSVTFMPAPGVPDLRELVLNLAENMQVPADGITRAGFPGLTVPHRREGDVLRVDLAAAGGPLPAATSGSVTIRYSGFPQQDGGVGLQFSVFGRFPNHVPSIYTISQPFAARTWWPCKDRPDDKATVTVRVDVPEALTVISNGTLAGRVPSGLDGNVITAWREREPIAPYLVAIYISDYARCDAEYVSPLTSSVRTPVTSWAWPSKIDQACQAWSATPAMMREFAQRFGEYPFAQEKYANVAVQPLARYSPYIGMENQTASAIGAGWLALQHESLIAHELAHQWWGNSVTPRAFDSLWLNEGFATYAEAVWWESRYGLAEYRGFMRDLDLLRTAGEFVGPVDNPTDANGDGWPDGDASGPELTVYFKGAWVVHMLRWVLGQPSESGEPLRLRRVMQAFQAQHARSVVETEDFVALADRMATDQFGMRDGLRWFFEQWLDREDRPCYRVAWSAVPAAPGTEEWQVQLVVEQARWGLDEDLGVMTCADPQPSPYRMPVLARVSMVDGSTASFIVDNRQATQAYRFTVASQPSSVAWDPDGWILKATQSISADMDGDGWLDPFDSCPLVPDPLQTDADADGTGDACQDGLDFDGDGAPNEADCAPANPVAWTDPATLPTVPFRVMKDAQGIVLSHGLPPSVTAPEQPFVLDLAGGRLDRLRENRGNVLAASCLATGRTADGDLFLPADSVPGSRYFVLLPWNGCGHRSPSGVPDDPCR